MILLHLNNQYVDDGRELDLDSLSIFSDLTQEALGYQEELLGKVHGLKDRPESPHLPEIVPSRTCFSPNPSEFWEHCRQGLPEHWIIELGGIGQNKLEELASMGVQEI